MPRLNDIPVNGLRSIGDIREGNWVKRYSAKLGGEERLELDGGSSGAGVEQSGEVGPRCLWERAVGMSLRLPVSFVSQGKKARRPTILLLHCSRYS
jgi:hypothetical protein